MTELTSTQPRALAPRRLEQRESLHSLNHWKSVFRNFYRRCPYYGHFLLPATKWDNTPTRGFTTAEQTGLKRDITTLAADLEGFLDCLASFLPFDYIGEKLKQESTDISSAWSIIYEVYDAELTTTNFLDYATMEKNPEETYRGFFNRLVGFVRQHLPSEAFTAEGVSCPTNGETLTIALLDAITIHWLLSIDKRLLKIIKTEFATDLKTKRLCQMVKTISQSIDELILRYEQKDQVSAIHSFQQDVPVVPVDSSPVYNNDSGLNSLVQRIERLESSSKYNNRRKKPPTKPKSNVVKCAHCLFLNQQLGASLPTNHPSYACGKKNVSVNLIESLNCCDQMEASHFSSPSDEGDVLYKHSQLIDFFQKNKGDSSVASSEETVTNHSSIPVIKNDLSLALIKNNETPVSDQTECACKQLVKPVELEQSKSNPVPVIQAAGNVSNTSNMPSAEPSFSVLLAKLSTTKFEWQNLQKSNSPRLKCMFNGTVFSALVDSGAEVNVIDKDFAQKLQIQVVASKTVAQAANRIPLDVYGQTSEPINVQCMTDKGNKMLHLGVMLVVTNLGCPFLLGEPAKMTNNIICLPRQKLILLANGEDVQCANYDENGIKYTLVRAISNVVLNPGDQLQYKLPDEFQQEEYVAISPRPNSAHWLLPTILHPVDNIVYISNSTTFPVEIKKLSHLADIRSTILVSPVHISPFPQATHSDDFQFQNFAMTRDIKPEYVQQIQVDPDRILNDSDRDLFNKLHIRFQSVFTP